MADTPTNGSSGKLILSQNTPLTIGLLVILLGGAATVGGAYYRLGNVDTKVSSHIDAYWTAHKEIQNQVRENENELARMREKAAVIEDRQDSIIRRTDRLEQQGLFCPPRR